MSDISIYPVVVQWLNEEFRYDKFAFTPFSTSAAWSEQFGDTTPISQFITPRSFLPTVMQTRHQRNPANNNMDVDSNNETDATGETEAAGANLFSPPNVRRNATDPAGVNITPLTAQRRTNPGGLSDLLRAFFQGGTNDQQVPGQPNPDANSDGVPPVPPIPGGAPPVPPVQPDPQPQQQATITELLLQLFQQQQQQAQAPPATPTVDPNMAAILAMMQAQQAQTTAVL
jgi:hypothetical protein